jgi:hypothetical protein
MLRRPADVNTRLRELHDVFAVRLVGIRHAHNGGGSGTTPIAAPQATRRRARRCPRAMCLSFLARAGRSHAMCART